MCANERIGLAVKDSEMIPFQNTMAACDLQDIKTTGAFFTWTNKQPSATRVFSRIDRVLVNDSWLQVWLDYYAHFALEGSFDHCFCVVEGSTNSMVRRKPFKFFNMWSKVADFHYVVDKGWQIYYAGSPMFKLVQKLKSLKPLLKELNRSLFSDIEKNAEIAYKFLLGCQKKLHLDPGNTSLMDMEYQARESYLMLSIAKDDFLRQKAKAFVKYFEQLLGSNSPTFQFYPHVVEQGPSILSSWTK
ncbi:uncharacterized protein LOC141628569 [Silene latifolia]|uniref:uncharacterized protein LOC141628569 n=1 Tax=Silene latifolia TaxID=37657 RepID=UPI003D77FAB5